MTRIRIDKQVSVKVESDTLLTRVTIHGRGDDEESCLRGKKADQEALLSALSDIDLERILLETDRVGEEYESIDGKRTKTGMSYTLGYRIVGAMGGEEKIEKALLCLKDRVSYVHSYALSDPDEAKKLALDMAIQKAREMAETIAESLSLHIVGVEEVTSEDYQQGPVMLRSAKAITSPEHESSIQSHVQAVFLAE